MNRDLQVAGAIITLVIGLRLVKGNQKAELESLGQLLSAVSAMVLLYHAAERFGG
jgi:hypothetical protein